VTVVPNHSGGRRKVAVFAVGAIGVAAALTAAAFITPNREATAAPTYTPTDPHAVIAIVPTRDPQEISARAALAASPDRVDVAVRLARADIQRARSLSDPRYLGRAQATLSRWWKLPNPPPDVLLLRATIEQSLHDFTAARADLDRLVEIRPRDVQAHLTRAVVATVTGDYAAARQSCMVVAASAPPVIGETCIAPLEAVAGHAREAYVRLADVVQRSADADPALRDWAATGLAELAIMNGDYAAAAQQLRASLAIDPDDAYARAALADVLLWTDKPAEASALLAGREQIDNLLVRRAIAEHVAHGPDEAKLVGMMRDRIAAADERGDRIHMREQARFEVEVENNAKAALAIAKDNWDVQKELADARLLAECAALAGDSGGAEPVRAWAKQTGVKDVQLDRWLGGAR
jgi:tetratricopeptide (TPR) repeat protein